MELIELVHSTVNTHIYELGQTDPPSGPSILGIWARQTPTILIVTLHLGHVIGLH